MQLPIDTNMFVVQWSKIANCYHTESIAEMLETNNKKHLLNLPCDYIPVAFAETYEEGQRIIAKMESRRSASQQA